MYSWKVQLIGILAFGVERSTSSSYWTLNQPMLYYTDHLHVTISNPLLFLWWFFQLYRLYWYDNDITLRDWVINKKDKDFSVDVIKLNVLFTQPSPWTGWVSIWHVSLWFCVSVCNHFSSHPPPYIELSFSSSLCQYIYSPQTSQIQALEEGSARTCVGATP